VTSEAAEHRLARVETIASRGHRAHCTCGWMSVVAVSATVAGTLWDEHLGDVTTQ
jgi:hypothetical protein